MSSDESGLSALAAICSGSVINRSVGAEKL